MKALLFSITLIFGLAAGATTSSWDDLKARMVSEGASTETQYGIYMTLTDRVDLPAPVKGHHVDYISAVGQYDLTGTFVTYRIESVSETWKIDQNGNWDIEQWLFMTNPAGEVLRSNHIHLVESPTGSILAYDYIPTTEEEFSHQWKSTVTKWIEQK